MNESKKVYDWLSKNRTLSYTRDGVRIKTIKKGVWVEDFVFCDNTSLNKENVTEYNLVKHLIKQGAIK